MNFGKNTRVEQNTFPVDKNKLIILIPPKSEENDLYIHEELPTDYKNEFTKFNIESNICANYLKKTPMNLTKKTSKDIPKGILFDYLCK